MAKANKLTKRGNGGEGGGRGDDDKDGDKKKRDKKKKKKDVSSSSSDEKKKKKKEKKQYRPPDQTCPKCGKIAIIGMKYCSYCNPGQVGDPATLIIAPAMEPYKSNFLATHLRKGRFTLEQRADAMRLWADEEKDVYTRKDLTAVKLPPLPRHCGRRFVNDVSDVLCSIEVHPSGTFFNR